MVEPGQMIARRDPQIRRPPTSAGLYDVVDLILEKGLVIDAFVRVSLVGIELLTVDARVVIASVDTYLRYAAEAERLQIYQRSESKRLPDMVSGAAQKKGLATGVKSVAKRLLGGEEDDEGENNPNRGQEKEGVAKKLVKGVRSAVGRLVHGDEGEEEEEESNEDEGQRRQEKPHRGNGSGKPAKSGARR